jgi:hypothetical protein
MMRVKIFNVVVAEGYDNTLKPSTAVAVGIVRQSHGAGAQQYLFGPAPWSDRNPDGTRAGHRSSTSLGMCT